MDNKMFTGYSNRAFIPEFREEIRNIRKDNLKKAIIKNIIFAIPLIPAVLIIVMAYIRPELTLGLAIAVVAAVAAIPVFGILTVIRTVITIGDASLIKDLDRGYWEGEVTGRQELTGKSTDEHGYDYERRDYRLLIKRDNGKTVRFDGVCARKVIECTKNGDKVRCHPGFIYPIELYDKSNGNICVFCGTINDAKNNTCSECGKPMLV